jgi:hypothetical protein
VVGNPVNDLGIRHDGAGRDEVRHELPDHHTLVMDFEPSLRLKRDAAQPELHPQTVLIDLIVESVPDAIERVHGTANDLIDLGLKPQGRAFIL